MTGATLTLDWSQAGTATATMTAPNGTVTGQSTIQQQDKVDPAKSVGTAVAGSKVTQAAGQTASSNEQSSTTTPSEPASSVASSSQATNSGNSSTSSSSKESGSTNANPSSNSGSSAVTPSSSSASNQESSSTKPSTPSSSSASSSSADQPSTPSTPSTPSEPVVTDKVLGVPFVSQGNTMLCEGSSLLEGLLYKGYTTQNLSQFVQSMPL